MKRTIAIALALLAVTLGTGMSASRYSAGFDHHEEVCGPNAEDSYVSHNNVCVHVDDIKADRA